MNDFNLIKDFSLFFDLPYNKSNEIVSFFEKTTNKIKEKVVTEKVNIKNKLLKFYLEKSIKEADCDNELETEECVDCELEEARKLIGQLIKENKQLKEENEELKESQMVLEEANKRIKTEKNSLLDIKKYIDNEESYEKKPEIGKEEMKELKAKREKEIEPQANIYEEPEIPDAGGEEVPPEEVEEESLSSTNLKNSELLEDKLWESIEEKRKEPYNGVFNEFQKFRKNNRKIKKIKTEKKQKTKDEINTIKDINIYTNKLEEKLLKSISF